MSNEKQKQVPVLDQLFLYQKNELYCMLYSMLYSMLYTILMYLRQNKKTCILTVESTLNTVYPSSISSSCLTEDGGRRGEWNPVPCEARSRTPRCTRHRPLARCDTPRPGRRSLQNKQSISISRPRALLVLLILGSGKRYSIPPHPQKKLGFFISDFSICTNSLPFLPYSPVLHLFYPVCHPDLA